jgi:hypothetical protein
MRSMGCTLYIRCALSIHQKECRKSLGCALSIHQKQCRKSLGCVLYIGGRLSTGKYGNLKLIILTTNYFTKEQLLLFYNCILIRLPRVHPTSALTAHYTQKQQYKHLTLYTYAQQLH